MIISDTTPIKPESVRLLFVPDEHTRNDSQIKQIYSRIAEQQYDTVVFIESRLMDIPKKIPMPSVAEFVTPAGTVSVNDALRNEFCDEDDDFFIDDSAFGQDMEIYRHLPYLIETLNSFKIVSVPICDDDPAIVRELDYVLSELLNGRNVLIVVAASMPGDNVVIEELMEMIAQRDVSGMMNRINSGECGMSGSAAFMGGILIALSWELSVHFLESSTDEESAVAGFAVLQSKL